MTKQTLTRILLPLLSCALNASAQANAPETSGDAGITERVRTAIFHRADVASTEISVQTHDGVVYLHGLVDTNVQRSALEDIAKSSPGVRRVVDLIELRNPIR